MILMLMIVIPCCLVGALVYAAMSRWELTDSGPAPVGGGSGEWASRSRLPRLTMRETIGEWPVPQLQRLHPGVLIGISAVLALWVVIWIVVFFVGLSMLHA